MIKLDWNKYLETAAQTAAEGIVMLKNQNKALPLAENETVSIFGRIQLHYYKSGTGSGGMVNVSKVTGVVEGLQEAGVRLNEELLEAYRRWDSQHPFDNGSGWGGEPWSQEEMPVSEELVRKAAGESSAAIVIIGRTAGEEMDAGETPGSFLLTDTEKEMLTQVRRAFPKMIVLLNVGGLIDLEFIERVKPDALLYIWQGGMTGGTGAAAVLTGRTSPSGKLPDTIALNVSDYPSHRDFGDVDRNFYTEDIYVGYRYFETFAKDRVRYPFGFGLSYTSFSLSLESHAQEFDEEGASAGIFRVNVKNTGDFPGKEVVQIYLEKPQGALGQPARELIAYGKTCELKPGEAQTLELRADLRKAASYDDSGVTGNRFCRVLEAGDYIFYLGTDVRSAKECACVTLDKTQVTERCSQALAPVESFDRIRPEASENGYVSGTEPVPLNETDEDERRRSMLPTEISFTGDKGIKLADVADGRNTLEQFIAQLSDDDLACLVRGEGMGSPRVTAGTASAFGGVSASLEAFGVPAACCSDGPSGMRLDCGTKAFSLPNGTMIASTFDQELTEKLFGFMGLEMRANKVDCLLGPGMNIHRHPLNGRNFEYFSEDPFLTGTMAAAELRGLHSAGVTGTIKHFCGNNQETNRHFLDTAASERALRDIYLRGFEIAVKEGGADSIMTTYGKVNGLWTAGSYDLNTVILRNEWGFRGITMTDWWANINRRGGEADKSDLAAMAKTQNDLYMVCADSEHNPDNLLASLASGDLSRGELQRNAANILGFLIDTHAMARLMGREEKAEITGRPETDNDSDEPVVFYDLGEELTIDLSGVKSRKGTNYSFALTVADPNWYRFSLTASSAQSELAQIPVTIFAMGTASGTFTWNGTGGKPVTFSSEIPMFSHFTAVRLYFAQDGLDLISLRIENTHRSFDIDAKIEKEQS